jgi:hypothetical protein
VPAASRGAADTPELADLEEADGPYLPRRLGVWDSAEPAAVLAAFAAFGLRSVLLAAFAAFGLVCLVFRLILITSSVRLRGAREE